MESSILPDDIDDEEVWLYWIDSNKEPHGKAIRHLAQEAREGTKADLEVLTYYRYWGHSYSHHVITGSWFSQTSENYRYSKRVFKNRVRRWALNWLRPPRNSDMKVNTHGFQLHFLVSLGLLFRKAFLPAPDGT